MGLTDGTVLGLAVFPIYFPHTFSLHHTCTHHHVTHRTHHTHTTHLVLPFTTTTPLLPHTHTTYWFPTPPHTFLGSLHTPALSHTHHTTSHFLVLFLCCMCVCEDILFVLLYYRDIVFGMPWQRDHYGLCNYYCIAHTPTFPDSGHVFPNIVCLPVVDIIVCVCINVSMCRMCNDKPAYYSMSHYIDSNVYSLYV